jgi:hypothetical protein
MDAATQQLIGTIITTLGTSGGLVLLINGLIKWLSGFSHRERVRNTNLAARAEKEANKRRAAEEHVSILRRQIRELGAVPLELDEEE